MNYFKIQVKAGSKSELEKRVADNKKRGFELVSISETESCKHVYSASEYRGVDISKRFVAVMRRENRDRLAQ